MIPRLGSLCLPTPAAHGRDPAHPGMSGGGDPGLNKARHMAERAWLLDMVGAQTSSTVALGARSVSARWGVGRNSWLQPCPDQAAVTLSITVCKIL